MYAGGVEEHRARQGLVIERERGEGGGSEVVMSGWVDRVG